MEGLGFIVMILLAFVLFDIAAVFLGVDSSDSSRDPRQPYRPTEPFRPTGIITH